MCVLPGRKESPCNSKQKVHSQLAETLGSRGGFSVTLLIKGSYSSTTVCQYCLIY